MELTKTKAGRQNIINRLDGNIVFVNIEADGYRGTALTHLNLLETFGMILRAKANKTEWFVTDLDGMTYIEQVESHKRANKELGKTWKAHISEIGHIAKKLDYNFYFVTI